MTAARTLEQAGEGGGNLPVILTTAQVQYIHTVRNKKVRRVWPLARGVGSHCECVVLAPVCLAA
jgi:hypothetical protein